jgi:PBS lyase HEAT-like repeat
VSSESILRLREIALDGTATDESRHAAVDALAELRTSDAVDALLELGRRASEPAAILRATGRALARLTDGGLVSQWDARDLADEADEAFYE